MQILLQMLAIEAPVEKLTQNQNIDLSELGPAEAPEFTLDIGDVTVADDVIKVTKTPAPFLEADIPQIAKLGDPEIQLRNEAQVVKSVAELGRFDLETTTKTDTAGDTLPVKLPVQVTREIVVPQEVRPDRATPTTQVFASERAQNPLPNGRKAPALGAEPVLPARLPDTKEVAKPDIIGKGARIANAKAEPDVQSSRPVRTESDQQLIKPPHVPAEKVAPDTAKSVLKAAPIDNAAAKALPESRGPSNTPIKVKRSAETAQAKPQAVPEVKRETPGKPTVAAAERAVLEPQARSAPQDVAIDKRTEPPRTPPIETLQREPGRPVSTDKPVAKGPPAETPVEITYRPNKPVDVSEARARTGNREDIIPAGPREIEKTTRGEVVAVAPVQKPETAKRDNRPLQSTNHRLQDDQQVQQQTNANQSLPKPQPVTLGVPVFFAPGLKGAEISGYAENMQTVGDGELQASVDGPENRKETPGSSKIEPFARPVLQQVGHAVKTLGNGSVEIKLAPEELGKVRLSLNPGEANMTVHISAERPETMDLIRRNIDLLSHSLKQEGFTNLSFSFGNSGGDHAQEKSDTNAFEFSGDTTETLSDIPASQTPRNLIAGQLDIRI